MQRIQVILISMLIVILTGAGSFYYARNSSSFASQPKSTVNVLYAGSLLSVMEQGLGPAFVTASYDYKGEGHGSVQNANFVIDGQRFPDIFISAGLPPIQMLFNNNPPLAKWYITFAADEIVIAYSNKSRFLDQFEKASQGLVSWYQVLANPEVRFLRTDPEQDPKGYYMIIVARLADLYYGNSTISSSILRGTRNPTQLRPEEILRTLLESGECDAIPLYKHEAVERRLPFISLPPSINLGSLSYADNYKSATYRLQNNRTVFGEPIVFAVTMPTTANNLAGAVRFVQFLLSDVGQQILRVHGFSPVQFTAGGQKDAIPPEITTAIGTQTR